MSKSKQIVLGSLAGLVVVLLTASLIVRPSNNRRWTTGQERLPTAAITGSSATIHDIRNFAWANAGATATKRWDTRSFNLDQIETAWFILAPFSRENRGPAHTFLSFGFTDSQYIAISIEARREVGEEYSILKGMLRRFEIMYVIGDEHDLIGLRSLRGDDVYVYPIRASREKIRALFVQMLERANELAQHPEFYNTITNNCTTNILKHANRITPHRIPYGKEVLLPGYADELAQRLGLLDTSLPIEQARQAFLVNDRARASANDPDFSRRIRGLN